MTFVAVAPYICLGILGLVELTNPRPRRTGTQRVDRGSFWIIQIVGGGGMFLAFSIKYSPHGVSFRLGSWAAVVGILMTLLGGVIRAWAIRSLGAYFTRAVQVSADQPVVEAGPYRWVRHPSYTGGLLEFLGIGLACCNWVALVAAIVPMAAAYAVRIRIEEAALVAAIGEPYLAYQSRTKSLVPYLF